LAVALAGGALILLGQLALLLWTVKAVEWIEVLKCTGFTFLRVLGAVLLGTLWAVPAGIWIGLNPKWSRLLQPVTQVAASFPAPMLFPLVTGLFLAFGASFQWVSMLLIMLGTQWYLLFNVMSGARGIPQDLRSCSDILRLSGWVRWRTLYLPAVFPSLVTGWITAAGGAWNASIVAEYLRDNGKLTEATGLGDLISRATDHANYGQLAAGVLAMVIVVVCWNRSVWKPLQRWADEQFRLMA
jgi:NitT/TauT family transport system permease protein